MLLGKSNDKVSNVIYTILLILKINAFNFLGSPSNNSRSLKLRNHISARGAYQRKYEFSLFYVLFMLYLLQTLKEYCFKMRFIMETLISFKKRDNI